MQCFNTSIDVSIEYATQHWFPLNNPKLRKQDGSPGEVCMKIGTDQKGMVNKYMDDMDDRTVEDMYDNCSRSRCSRSRSFCSRSFCSRSLRLCGLRFVVSL